MSVFYLYKTNCLVFHFKMLRFVYFQALIAAGNYKTDFDMAAAIKFILQSISRNYPDTKDIYNILPLFNSKSLINISSDHCAASVKTGKKCFMSFYNCTKN